ncbi:diacylglycerol kinase family protein [Pedobacter sp. JY14-1]|uniref:diacylglycerol/lipid kinase family protein n=1 Tax=Pedobacter sp. JY14-1 TaxID=3034151 RepID=UPI0023E25B16|nr:diacylglycerol kinase family protein [Pedobacter sp. JY14-1]
MKKTGRLISLVHNPTAGEGEHSKTGIIRMLASHGYRCNYSSSKKKILKTIAPETELIAIAGGDGTIRKTVMRLLDKKLKYKRPIALLPFGTANNIASSLNIPEDNNKNISSWDGCHLKKFDVGQVTGLQSPSYFIESFGFGLFARLMKNLKKMDTSAIEKPEEEFQLALKELLELSRSYAAVPFKMEINGKTIEDKAILIEVMNISSLGPHLKLSRTADPEDGLFDVVIVTEKQRSKMEAYITGKIRQEKPLFTIKSVQAKKLKIEWLGRDLHTDDQVLDIEGYPPIHISLLDSLLEVVTPTGKK